MIAANQVSTSSRPNPCASLPKFTLTGRPNTAPETGRSIAWGWVFAALQRHLWVFWGGRNLDPESGLPHLTHAAWGCLSLLEYFRTHPELDDKPSCHRRQAETWMPRQNIGTAAQGNGAAKL